MLRWPPARSTWLRIWGLGSLFVVLVDADTAVGRKRLADALNALARFSLATVDDDSVSVHRLLQKTVCDDAAARNDKTAALRALAALDDAFPEDVRLPANWPLCEQLLAHALALADALQQPGEAGPQLINLLNRASDYLNRAEPGQRGLATAQITLRHAERVLGPGHPHTLTTRDHLALAYHYAGRSGEAIAILEPLLADHERILGVEHPETLTTRHNLALAYLEAGRVGEALRICEALLTDRERILGPDHRETLRARNNLGRAYLDEGRVDDAIAIYEPVLADRQRVLGPEHPEGQSREQPRYVPSSTAGPSDTTPAAPRRQRRFYGFGSAGVTGRSRRDIWGSRRRRYRRWYGTGGA